MLVENPTYYESRTDLTTLYQKPYACFHIIGLLFSLPLRKLSFFNFKLALHAGKVLVSCGSDFLPQHICPQYAVVASVVCCFSALNQLHVLKELLAKMTNIFVVGSTVTINKEQLSYLWAGLCKFIFCLHASHMRNSALFSFARKEKRTLLMF